ncbi:UDP-N-acetylmuramoyl-L-alanine--D-glutamate ligase [Erythrobacter litoralis]|uniref:UDP-N-acetylmuramoylalanine--D-glutamate ligase n=1 Tax=Erythrobacter litoralis (strain HTCC2594) TaxID=314225 RepID=Q2NCZ2_ERYLH|nr:UDP-N-acetylmuramoyl-L-alanine--D-glutamate ligase [Erythrobacter litoralis]ABC62449.1 UDP-N-acetylmuramoylalanine-D-glutamate ligase [Erythrobacter litoralis HTCC2594]
MITCPAWSGKSFAVLGLARSGQAAAEALLASGADVMVWDRQEEPRAAFEGRARVGDPMSEDLTGIDGLVVSPGVPLNTHPIVERAGHFGVPIIGDIELFAQARSALPPHRVIGITGTNGKSTTTALVTHLLKEAGVEARMGGNIGLPILGEEPLPEGGVYVLELSSYQIDLTRSLACEAAALLNITPDHLDRYDGFESYAFSKGRLFTMQGSGQFACFGCEDAQTRAVCNAAQSRRAEGRAICLEPEQYAAMQGDWPALQGPHNLQNVAAAIALVEEMGVTRGDWEAGLTSYSGLPHRMEVVCEHESVLFVNDSKATNPASTAPALAAWPADPEPRVHWIVGGLAKEDGLGECEAQLGNIKRAYAIGEAGPRFAELLGGRVPVERSELICEAVKQAVSNAEAGDIVLLSPACASFDQFRDFEKRGEHFRQLVGALSGCDIDDICEPTLAGNGDMKGEAA